MALIAVRMSSIRSSQSLEDTDNILGNRFAEMGFKGCVGAQIYIAP